MQHLILMISAVVIALSSRAQTWNQDIAPIFFEHCGKCHHEGGIAPSSLLTYNDALSQPYSILGVIEVHYAPGSQDQSSAVKMRLKYKPAGNIRTVYHDPLLFHGPPSLQEPALIIPPNEISTFHEESVTTNVPLSFLSVFPHMHLLGKTFKVYALDANQDTIRFIDVDDYDFHWQFNYKFPTLLPVPTGSRLYGEATYDNTTANEENPNNPPQWVFLGENTTDEMMVCFFMYTVYQAGDENMSQVSVYEYSNDSPTRMLVYPNPVMDKLYVDYPNDIKNIQSIQLFDSNGRVAKAPYVLFNGRLEITTNELASGVYDLVVKGEGRTLTEKVIKQ